MLVCSSLVVWQQQLPWLALLWELCLGRGGQVSLGSVGQLQGTGHIWWDQFWKERGAGMGLQSQPWGAGIHLQSFSPGSLHLPRAQPLFPGPLWISSLLHLPHQPQAELLHKPSPSFHIALSSLTLQPQRSHLSSRCLYHDLHCYWVLNIIFFPSAIYQLPTCKLL